MEQRRLVAVRLSELVAASCRFSASLSDRSRVRMVGIVVATNLVSRAASPHLLFIGLRDGAHQPHLGLGVPDQDASQGSAQLLDWPGGDQPNSIHCPHSHPSLQEHGTSSREMTIYSQWKKIERTPDLKNVSGRKLCFRQHGA